MSLLIDGYNLLYATGIVGRGHGPGYFERSRKALLNFLAESIEPAEVPRTTVVFDAAEAPPGLPHTLSHRGLSVRFAAQHADADELIEKLIQADTSPRQLTVVSSDHRLQRAAKRRKATAVDSDVWYAQVSRRRNERRNPISREAMESKPQPSTAEVEYWLREFGMESFPDDAAWSIFPPGYGEEEA